MTIGHLAFAWLFVQNLRQRGAARRESNRAWQPGQLSAEHHRRSSRRCGSRSSRSNLRSETRSLHLPRRLVYVCQQLARAGVHSLCPTAVFAARGRTRRQAIVYPIPLVGLAALGEQVYARNGCIYCHSQQVRPEGFGADFERGWGPRRTVARDYLYNRRVMLGTMRTGPDLANIGARQPSKSWHHLHLYNPQITSPGSIMPPFAFLYEERPIVGEPSVDALDLPPDLRRRRITKLFPRTRHGRWSRICCRQDRTYPLEEAQQVMSDSSPENDAVAKPPNRELPSITLEMEDVHHLHAPIMREQAEPRDGLRADSRVADGLLRTDRFLGWLLLGKLQRRFPTRCLQRTSPTADGQCRSEPRSIR